MIWAGRIAWQVYSVDVFWFLQIAGSLKLSTRNSQTAGSFPSLLAMLAVILTVILSFRIHLYIPCSCFLALALTQPRLLAIQIHNPCPSQISGHVSYDGGSLGSCTPSSRLWVWRAAVTLNVRYGIGLGGGGGLGRESDTTKGCRRSGRMVSERSAERTLRITYMTICDGTEPLPLLPLIRKGKNDGVVLPVDCFYLRWVRKALLG